jgi:hypothetical protein
MCVHMHHWTRVTYLSRLVTVMSHCKSGFQKKEVKALYFFGWGGHQKTILLIYIIFLPNRLLVHLSLHETSFFILAGKSHLFIFPEQALRFISNRTLQ